MKSLAAALIALVAAAVLLAAPGSSAARRMAPRPPPPPVAVAGDPPLAVTGSYDSNWGALKLSRSGDRITGTYECCGGGTIDGTLSGNVIRYRWTQPGGSGLGVWVVASTGELIGTWGVGDEVSGGGWNLRRTATAVTAHVTR